MNPAPPDAGGSLDQAPGDSYSSLANSQRTHPTTTIRLQHHHKDTTFSRLFSVLYTQDSLYTLLILEEDITATTQTQLRHPEALNR